MNKNNILIIGAGIAGLTAAIYIQRAGKQAIVFEKNAPGGQIITANEIENYPGMASVNGADLGFKLYQQAMDLGAHFVYEEVVKIVPEENRVTIQTAQDTYSGKSLIYAGGASHRHLGLANEEKLIGHGISYCANCDGAFFKDKVVAVNGGGNIALDDAIYLSSIAKEVYLIHRRNTYRAETVLQEKLATIDNIHPITNTIICGLEEKQGKLSGLALQNVQTKEKRSLAVDGLFVAIGMQPETSLLEGIVYLDKSGYIQAGEDTRTNVKNIFVAGDVRTKNVRQLTTAAADGTAAAILAASI